MQYVALAIHGLTLGSIYALVALGFHLIYRAAGVLDFAQGDKVVIGGLVGLTFLHQSLPLIIGMVLATVGGLAAGVAYDGVVVAPTLRRGSNRRRSRLSAPSLLWAVATSSSGGRPERHSLLSSRAQSQSEARASTPRTS